jgi:DNA-nicking Smr family endonuclease
MSDDDDVEFGGMIPGVKRMHSDRINVYRQRERKPFAPRAPAPETVIDPEPVMMPATARAAHFDPGLQNKLQRRIRQGQIRPQDSLDLHGYRQSEAIDALKSFLDHALRAGYRMVIIVHGQGYRSPTGAVLKPLVQRWLADRPEVLAWCPAQPQDGAAGASYVYLRSP